MKRLFGFLTLAFMFSFSARADESWKLNCNIAARGQATKAQYQELIKFAMEHFIDLEVRGYYEYNKKGQENVDYFLPKNYVHPDTIRIFPRSTEPDFYVPRTKYPVTLKNGETELFSLEMEQGVSHQIGVQLDKNSNREDICLMIFAPLYIRIHDLGAGKSWDFDPISPKYPGFPRVEITDIVKKWD